MVQEFEAVRTKFTTLEFVKALVVAWKREFNTDITLGQARLVFSKASHETNGSVSAWNWNVGNIKFKVNGNNGMAEGYAALTGVWEIVNGKKIILDKSNPGSWFRSYASLSDGITDYLKLLNNTRYSCAFQALKEENLEEYCTRLHQKGYYTDDPKNYIAGLKRWANKFDNKVYQQALDSLKQEETPEIIELPEVEIVGEEKIYEEPLDIVKDNDYLKKKQSVEEVNFFQQILNFILGILNMFKR